MVDVAAFWHIEGLEVMLVDSMNIETMALDTRVLGASRGCRCDMIRLLSVMESCIGVSGATPTKSFRPFAWYGWRVQGLCI